jgi:OTT_1508-like deaminase
LIADKVLLSLVVARCRAKISSILREPYSMPFRAWYAAEQPSTSFLDSVPSDLVDEFKEYFYAVNTASGPGHINNDIIALAIRSAQHIISLGVTSSFSFEQQWTVYDTPTSPSTDSEQNAEDYETLDDVDFHKSITHRFLHKLARYRAICHTIVRELVALRRSGHNLDIAIETVPISITTFSPSDENEYPDLRTFLLSRMGVDARTLDPKKLDMLCDKWGTAWMKRNLILHAEMQLTLFYAMHDKIFPVRGYIGVSKKCCWCCDFVLKYA